MPCRSRGSSNTALDGVARNLAATAAEIAKFAETDLVCYRAGDPEVLVAAQSQAWDPLLGFARRDLGARFVCSEGVMFVAQSTEALAAVRRAVDAVADGPAAPIRLAALSLMTNLTGSVLIALAVSRGAMSLQDGWAAAEVDDIYQSSLWGCR
jgi:Chaperone required for the assembly of the mitochondrial F1-ATPase